jgi:hypothetical protein
VTALTTGAAAPTRAARAEHCRTGPSGTAVATRTAIGAATAIPAGSAAGRQDLHAPLERQAASSNQGSYRCAAAETSWCPRATTTRRATTTTAGAARESGSGATATTATTRAVLAARARIPVGGSVASANCHTELDAAPPVLAARTRCARGPGPTIAANPAQCVSTRASGPAGTLPPSAVAAVHCRAEAARTAGPTDS